MSLRMQLLFLVGFLLTASYFFIMKPLVFSRSDSEPFTVPLNLYILSTLGNGQSIDQPNLIENQIATTVATESATSPPPTIANVATESATSPPPIIATVATTVATESATSPPPTLASPLVITNEMSPTPPTQDTIGLFETPKRLLQKFDMNAYSHALLDRKNKLLFCWIPKNMCTQIKSLFCRKILKMNLGIGVTDSEHLMIHDTCYFKLPRYNHDQKDERTLIWDTEGLWKKWAIIRDPIERFVSGWTDKCGDAYIKKFGDNTCYGCRKNLTCFVERHYANMLEFSTKNKLNHSFTHLDHFLPQYWHCGFARYLTQYKIYHYDNSNDFRTEIRNDFRNIGWPLNLIDTGWGPNNTQKFLEPSQTIHRTVEKASKTKSMLIDNPKALSLLVRIYAIDYLRFNLSLPTFVREMCDTCEDCEFCAHHSLLSNIPLS